jgi:hypothetical protein
MQVINGTVPHPLPLVNIRTLIDRAQHKVKPHLVKVDILPSRICYGPDRTVTVPFSSVYEAVQKASGGSRLSNMVTAWFLMIDQETAGSVKWVVDGKAGEFTYCYKRNLFYSESACLIEPVQDHTALIRIMTRVGGTLPHLTLYLRCIPLDEDVMDCLEDMHCIFHYANLRMYYHKGLLINSIKAPETPLTDYPVRIRQLMDYRHLSCLVWLDPQEQADLPYVTRECTQEEEPLSSNWVVRRVDHYLPFVSTTQSLHEQERMIQSLTESKQVRYFSHPSFPFMPVDPEIRHIIGQAIDKLSEHVVRMVNNMIIGDLDGFYYKQNIDRYQEWAQELYIKACAETIRHDPLTQSRTGPIRNLWGRGREQPTVPVCAPPVIEGVEATTTVMFGTKQVYWELFSDKRAYRRAANVGEVDEIISTFRKTRHRDVSDRHSSSRPDPVYITL